MKTINEIFSGEMESEHETMIKECFVNIPRQSRLLLETARDWEPKFRSTANLDKVFCQLFYYFTGTAKLSHLSHDKGIWLVGQVGSGKSFLFDLFRAYTSEILRCNGFASFKFRNLVKEYKLKGEKAFDEINYIRNYVSAKPIYIDDFMNTKFEVKNYGDTGNVVESIIDIRYDMFEKHKKLTHVSTNIYPKQLAEMGIDERIISRCRQMFNIVELTGKDWRNI